MLLPRQLAHWNFHTIKDAVAALHREAPNATDTLALLNSLAQENPDPGCLFVLPEHSTDSTPVSV